jgi:DNA-binding IclR family transcriptional regulator
MEPMARSDVANLAAWDAPGGLPKDRIDRVAAHPRFSDSVRTLAANMQAAAADDRALDGVFKDAGRYLAAMWAIYLHVSGGLTLPRLKAICAQTGFLSPGRARALLAYMRYLGYVELLPVGKRGEPARYRPTPRFIESWRAHLRAALEAAQVIEPGARVVLDVFDRTEVFEAFARLQCEGLLEAAREGDRTAPVLEAFVNRHAGHQIVSAMIVAAPVFPPAEPIKLSLAATARRYGVSRNHVRRMFAEAEQRGMLTLDKDGTVVFLDAGRRGLEFHYAFQLVRLLIAAAKTLKERPEIGAAAS